MRIVISGDGDIAQQLVRALHRHHDVVVLEEDADVAERFDQLDIHVMHGHATDPETLLEAGIASADAFVACGCSDEANIIASMTAKRLGSAQVTCFVSRESYVQSFAGITEGDGMLAIDRIVWPQYMLADEIARIVLVPRAVDVEVFAGGSIWLMEFKVEEDSGLVGALPQLGLPRGVLAAAVRQGDDFFVPTGKTELAAGDRVAFMGGRPELRELEERFVKPRGKAAPKEREVVIVGGGTVGLTLAKRLEREPGLRLKIIESNKPRAEELAAQLKKTLVLRGDGTDLELLESEQVGRAHVLVSVTSNDEKNLLCSLLASQMGVPKIITRVNRRENVALFERVGIDVPLNPMITAINVVLNSLQDGGHRTLASVEGGKAAVVEIGVPEDFKATQIKDLERIKGTIIVAIMRGEKTIVPHGDDTVQPDDRLLVFALAGADEALEKLF
ncbi:MAG: Trk system potassium transporter TrkA [Acidobacteria bacterium]|nr:Trk system potassium transporter TrkA [Acidobacteriota bacterium]